MRTYLPWLLVLLGLETLSALTIFHPQAQTVLLVVLSLGMLVLAWRRPTLAAGLLLSEYVIGSKGALLRAGGDGLGHGGIPLRIAWFAAFFLGWLAWSIQHRTYRTWPLYLRGRGIYVVLGSVLLYAFLRGLFLHNEFAFDDANAWGAWLLLLPALDLIQHKKDELKKYIPAALVTAFGWLCAKTLILFYLFTHLTNQGWLEAIYLWVRRTGVGEITRALDGANAWRIFFQSHIYVLPVIVVGFWYILFHERLPRLVKAGIGLAFATLLVSLSRSLFIGAFAALIVSFLFVAAQVYTLWQENRKEDQLRPVAGILRFTGLAIMGFLMVVALFYAPPRSNGSLMNLLVARTNTGDEASMSRWKLLPALWGGIKQHPVLGGGFGATITYKSSDPRLVATTGGVYTTYAFEWGWLEHWLKFGLVGIPLMLGIMVRLIWMSWRSSYEVWIRGVLVTGLIGLMITHIFTPYLNHPLGIMWLIVVESLIFAIKPRSSLIA